MKNIPIMMDCCPCREISRRSRLFFFNLAAEATLNLEASKYVDIVESGEKKTYSFQEKHEDTRIIRIQNTWKIQTIYQIKRDK